MVPSLAFVGGLVVDPRRSKFHVADPTIDNRLSMVFLKIQKLNSFENNPLYAKAYDIGPKVTL